MAMIYTLVSSAKEWLAERFGEDPDGAIAEAEEAAKEDVRISTIYNDIFFGIKMPYEFQV